MAVHPVVSDDSVMDGFSVCDSKVGNVAACKVGR
jgi:hypothetical protein